jgi:hypothetical protein
MSMKETQLEFCWMAARDDPGPGAGAEEGAAATAAPGRFDREARWAEAEAALLAHYDAWTPAARPFFVAELMGLADRLRGALGPVVEDHPGEPPD